MKSIIFDLFGAYLGGRNRIYKRLCMCALLQNAVRDIYHPEIRILRIESVLCKIVGERNSEHGFFEFR